MLATAFASWASQAITRSLGPQASATGFLAVPVVGLASGWLILGEQLGPVDVVAFGLVLAGVAATSLPAAGWRDRARRWKLAPSNPPRAAVGYLPGPTAARFRV